jgi:hypothetical protein
VSSNRIRFALILALLAPALGGCSLFQHVDKPTCPRLSIPADADRLTRFRPGPGRDLTDVRFQVRIASYDGSCIYDKDTRKMTVSVRVGFTALLGPAATGRNATIEYFVAVPGYFPSPQAKQVLRFPITFPPGVNQADFKDDNIDVIVPVRDLSNLDKQEIFIGLQLVAADLDYNRTHPATR